MSGDNEAKRVLLLKHPMSKRDDRAARLLAERGFELDWRCPGEGEELPDPRDDHLCAIIYGGPESANDDTTKPYIRAELDWTERWLETGKPFLGICLGGQILARVLGAQVARHAEGIYEIGYVPIEPTARANGFLDTTLHVYHWHKEGFEVPAGAELLATGDTYANQAFRYGERTYGIQFHPEVTPTIFRRWIDEAGHCLKEPGAHQSERQLADGARYDAPLGAWLERFLDHWIGHPGESATATQRNTN